MLVKLGSGSDSGLIIEGFTQTLDSLRDPTPTFRVFVFCIFCHRLILWQASVNLRLSYIRLLRVAFLQTGLLQASLIWNLSTQPRSEPCCPVGETAVCMNLWCTPTLPGPLKQMRMWRITSIPGLSCFTSRSRSRMSHVSFAGVRHLTVSWVRKMKAAATFSQIFLHYNKTSTRADVQNVEKQGKTEPFVYYGWGQYGW